jgi:23S rRNA (adenine2503-C2)-methyltransferase
MNTEIQKIDIKELDCEQLVFWLKSHQIRPFRATQILKWIYIRQAETFEEMTDLKKEVRSLISEYFSIDRLRIQAIEKSKDGSCKYLFALRDGRQIESVLIPERDHYTLCISSQVGCAQKCRFCLTGKSGLVRNLTSGEIIAQIRDVLYRHDSNDKPITNIVFMGMGEPLANYSQVVKALSLLTNNEYGLKIANRRITLSTAGLVPEILKLGQDAKVNLAVSLNASDNLTRNHLMPINRTYPIEVLLLACQRYPLQRGRKITFEYILIRGVNDSTKDAKRLAKMLSPIKAKINLIPFNEHSGSDFRTPLPETIWSFRKILLDKHYITIIRHSKGRDIMAACGQLRVSVRAHS